MNEFDNSKTTANCPGILASKPTGQQYTTFFELRLRKNRLLETHFPRLNVKIIERCKTNTRITNYKSDAKQHWHIGLLSSFNPKITNLKLTYRAPNQHNPQFPKAEKTVETTHDTVAHNSRKNCFLEICPGIFTSQSTRTKISLL